MSTSPKTFHKGDSITAKSINKGIVGGIQNSSKTLGAKSTTVTNKGVVTYKGDQVRAAQSSWFIRWAQIVSVKEDYLECNFYNPVSSTALGSINVAKPYLLQTAPFDGQTISYIDGTSITYTKDATNPTWKRDHNDGSSNADHVITPNYYVGELILAINMPTNVAVSGEYLAWVELALGRYWAR